MPRPQPSRNLKSISLASRSSGIGLANLSHRLPRKPHRRRNTSNGGEGSLPPQFGYNRRLLTASAMSRSLDALPGFYVKIASQTRPPYESLSLGYLSNLLFFCYQVSES